MTIFGFCLADQCDASQMITALWVITALWSFICDMCMHLGRT